MLYYLVRVEGDDDRPEETSEWIAKYLSVTFHREVAARPWAVHLDSPGVIDDPKAWHRRDYKGDRFPPEPEEQTDV